MQCINLSHLFSDVSASEWALFHRREVAEESGVRVRIAVSQVASVSSVRKLLGGGRGGEAGGAEEEGGEGMKEGGMKEGGEGPKWRE